MKKSPSKTVAVVGAGIAGLAAARTLMQGGWDVHVFEQEATVGGRMASLDSELGIFDLGTQYFTVRDPRFQKVLKGSPAQCKPWRAVSMQGKDSSTSDQTLSVATASMGALAAHWAAPVQAVHRLHLSSTVTGIAPDALMKGKWQVLTQAGPSSVGSDRPSVYTGFDHVVLATPAAQAADLLRQSGETSVALRRGTTQMVNSLSKVETAPCWSIGLAFALATDPARPLGPAWDCARPNDHRIAWMVRELSKPGRTGVERWVVQATANWSLEHFNDSSERVQSKLLKSFAELTGIHAAPTLITAKRWAHAKTTVPLGKSYLLQGSLGLAVCGDYCNGYRVEDAFVSGLELALAMGQ